MVNNHQKAYFCASDPPAKAKAEAAFSKFKAKAKASFTTFESAASILHREGDEYQKSCVPQLLGQLQRIEISRLFNLHKYLQKTVELYAIWDQPMEILQHFVTTVRDLDTHNTIQVCIEKMKSSDATNPSDVDVSVRAPLPCKASCLDTAEWETYKDVAIEETNARFLGSFRVPEGMLGGLGRSSSASNVSVGANDKESDSVATLFAPVAPAFLSSVSEDSSSAPAAPWPSTPQARAPPAPMAPSRGPIAPRAQSLNQGSDSAPLFSPSIGGPPISPRVPPPQGQGPPLSPMSPPGRAPSSGPARISSENNNTAPNITGPPVVSLSPGMPGGPPTRAPPAPVAFGFGGA